MPLTTDPRDARLKRGTDDVPVAQQTAYLVLPDEELARGFVQPVRTSYRHKTCGQITSLGLTLAETYARDPWFYGGTFCVACSMHRVLTEFVWMDGTPMAPSEWPEDVLNAVMQRKKDLT